MTDKAFIAKAKASWQRVLAMQDKPGGADGQVLALAASMWAALHVDRLIEIAEGKG